MHYQVQLYTTVNVTISVDEDTEDAAFEAALDEMNNIPRGVISITARSGIPVELVVESGNWRPADISPEAQGAS